MLRQALIVGLILMTGSAAAQPLRSGPYYRAYCDVYEHRDMGGYRLRLPNGDAVTMASRPIGDTYWREVPAWNDHISSIRLDPGCTIRVWEHMDGQGASRTWSARRDAGLNVWYVGSAWNDRISSATCTCSR